MAHLVAIKAFFSPADHDEALAASHTSNFPWPDVPDEFKLGVGSHRGARLESKQSAALKRLLLPLPPSESEQS